MKIIALMPVKNEAPILDFTLENLSTYCDLIIIADQMSSDRSVEIIKKYKKVLCIKNERSGHSNEVRWDLLKEARKYGKNNFILMLDADEFIPHNLFKTFLKKEKFDIGTSFSFQWIQLWKTPHKYNNNKFWRNNFKPVAWVDNGLFNYENKIVINDHTVRIPEAFLKNCKKINYAPVLHLQWLFYKKSQIKQAWYRCCELIDGKRSARRINNTYACTLLDNNKDIVNINKDWISDYELKLNKLVKEQDTDQLRLNEIYSFFNKYGIILFEPLQIWHIPELLNEFIKIIGRKPKVKIFPKYIIYLNNIKNKIKNAKSK